MFLALLLLLVLLYSSALSSAECGFSSKATDKQRAKPSGSIESRQRARMIWRMAERRRGPTTLAAPLISGWGREQGWGEGGGGQLAGA